MQRRLLGVRRRVAVVAQGVRERGCDDSRVLGPVALVEHPPCRVAVADLGPDDPSSSRRGSEAQSLDVGLAGQERIELGFGGAARQQAQRGAHAGVRHPLDEIGIDEPVEGDPERVAVEQVLERRRGGIVVERFARGGDHRRALRIDARLAEEGVRAEPGDVDRDRRRSHQELVGGLGAQHVER